MKSIRRRLHRNLFQTLALLVVGFGVLFYLAFREAMVEEFDANQRILAEALTERFERLPDGGIEFDPTPEMVGRFAARPEAEYFQIWNRSDGTLFRSPSLREGLLRNAEEPVSQGETWDLKLPDGRRGRALAFQFEPQMDIEDEPREVAPGAPAQLLVLVYARSREFLDRVLLLAALSFAALAVLMPLCGALLLGRTVRKGLSPLDRLSNEIRSLRPGALHHRFAEDDLPEELRPIAGRLNNLLNRVGEALEREKRFSSNVAHELRTPIAELKTIAEVGLSAAGTEDDSAELRESLRDALEVTLQMERMVTALLGIRNAERGDTGLKIKSLDLVALVGRCWDLWRSKAESRELVTQFACPSSAVIQSDEALLGAVLSNILENAVSHSPRAGRVEGRLESQDGRWVLTVGNTNHDLREDDLRKIFEPYWRKDPSRSGAGHSGLGLSAAAAFARLLGAAIEVRLPRPDWFEAAVEIPASTTDPASPPAQGDGRS